MNIYEILQRNASDDGSFSEGKINSLSELTGKTKDELFEIYKSGEQSTIPAGNPSQWKRDTKLKFINENGRDAYKELIEERK